ncbi:GNAT family N-acetyltransferase [Bacillus sp. DX1.1]|uniref:GNAT family N-acetyltransferase n=1 Tax=unclassified Bacillus (in: firmicutes) TaxID=185979 RepID=UPI002570771D|nr:MULTISPECIES: GNAT family N-acetyltransferase [unclassified Bacillus (in: firmicutes)]MDM5154628.1 GNAT family N-acetyltransferase [Bacillus sp. DX1.1]WJE83520.1 GNAT family N-acetyltransferase [Bacillus sp. DX3.1]
MHIQKKKTLTMDEIQEMIDLAYICEQNDKIEYQSDIHVEILNKRNGYQVNEFLYYKEDQLVGFVSMYEFERPTKLELTGLVHPDFRRQKIGSLLLQIAMEEIKKRNIDEALLIINGASTSGKEFTRAATFQYICSEYSMSFKSDTTIQPRNTPKLQIVSVSSETLPTIALVASKAFNDEIENISAWLHKTSSSPIHHVYAVCIDKIIVGTITVCKKEEFVSISGFAIDPTYQGKGFGKQILQSIVHTLINEGHRNIGLEVETKNNNALKLYQQCGFEVTASHDYYTLLHL